MTIPSRVRTTAGAFDKRIRLERRVQTGTDGRGAPIFEWQLIKVVWGRLSALSAREFMANAGVKNEATHRLIIRYDASLGLTAEERAVYGGAAYTFMGEPTDTEMKRRELMVMTSKGLIANG